MENTALIHLEIDQSAVDVDLLRAVLVDKNKPATREGYTKDLIDFFLFVTQGETVYQAEGSKRKSPIKQQIRTELSRLSQSFVVIGRLKALELTARYRECMMQRGLQSNSLVCNPWCCARPTNECISDGGQLKSCKLLFLSS